MKRPWRLIGACSGWGAPLHTCEKGPEDLLKAKGLEKLPLLQGFEMLYPEKRAKEEATSLFELIFLLQSFNRMLANRVTEILDAKTFPIVIGGDHVNAVGMWNGVRRHLLKQHSPPPLGLLWLDAHMDAHTPETSLSGAWHGMPLAALLGYGDPRLAQLFSPDPVLKPEHVILVGVRSFEAGEALLLKNLNLRIYFADEVKRRGIKEVLSEALEILGSIPFGITLDLDVFDPQEAPGVGSPEPFGLSSSEFLKAISLFKDHPHFCALEIVEYNPEKDLDHKTRNLLEAILKEVAQ